VADVELKPVYLITGSDTPKVETAVTRLRRHFEPESVERVSAVDEDGAAVAALCNAGSLFGGRRLVVVDDVDGRPNAEGQLRNGWKAADVEAVAAYIASPAPDTVLALVARSIKRDSILAKSVRKAGDVLHYDVARGRTHQWVAERFRERGTRAEPDACVALLHLVGDDMHALAREVEKIALWAGDDPVGEHEVIELTAATAETPVYRISDAWGRRDIAELLEATEALLERSPRPVSGTAPMVAAALARQVTIVRRARRAEDRGLRPKEAMAELGVRHEFQAERAYQFGRNYSETELDDALLRLAELDHAIKGGSRLAPDLELERALVEATVPERREGGRGGDG
jgi:DNA polymerase-3 subunit delta